MNNYKDTVDWIHSFITLGEKPGLKRMDWLLERLNHPEERLEFIHVGGTNGKGSTVSFLRHILMEAGVNVGTFTSPFIERFNERISFNGNPIADDDLVHIAKKVRPIVEELSTTDLGSPTAFEVITTVALVYFAEVASPDVVILEVGIGGLYDSTNIITPLISLITNVGYDHMGMLGNTLEDIAAHKAGIIKPHVPIITTAENDKVLQVFTEFATTMQAPLYQLGKDFFYQTKRGRQSFILSTSFTKEELYTINMQGEHQIKNATLAVVTAYLLNRTSRFNISADAIKKGLEQTTWMGRFEIMQKAPLVVIDGAHNKEGIEALAKTIADHYADKNIYLIFSATKEKEVEALLPPLYQLVKEICFTTFTFPRAALSIDQYEQSSFPSKKNEDNWQKAIESQISKMSQDDLLLITGSLYFISEVRSWFQSNKKGSS